MKKLLLLALLFAGCSKKNNDKEQTDLLVNKKWVMTGYAEQKPNGPIIDKWTTLKDYQKDDYFLFNSDHTYLYSDGKKIDPQFASDTFDTGTWQLYNSNTTLLLQSPNVFYHDAISITELTNTTMKWKQFYYAMDTTIAYSTFTAE